VAIVGARAADEPGQSLAFQIASDLASEGVIVVSGGAVGIDQAAHRGSLAGGGKTVIVLGCGLDVDYPAGSRELRGAVTRSGAVVTELSPGASPKPHHFPRRNRLVAALSEAVLVVQAGVRSGALSTAGIARKLGRPVLAVPGTPGAALTRGTHGLLRRGALLAEGADDVLRAMDRRRRSAEPRREAAAPQLDGLEALLHESIRKGSLSADELARSVDRPVSEVLVALLGLEMQGLVVNRGGCYERS
jgi:DNA processing protein